MPHGYGANNGYRMYEIHHGYEVPFGYGDHHGDGATMRRDLPLAVRIKSNFRSPATVSKSREIRARCLG